MDASEQEGTGRLPVYVSVARKTQHSALIMTQDSPTLASWPRDRALRGVGVTGCTGYYSVVKEDENYRESTGVEVK